jgi:hypothetical protein
MASPPATGQQLALDIMYFGVEHPGCMYVIPTGAASVAEKSLADFMCGLFGDNLSPLQPANVAEREYMRCLTTLCWSSACTLLLREECTNTKRETRERTLGQAMLL